MTRFSQETVCPCAVHLSLFFPPKACFFFSSHRTICVRVHFECSFSWKTPNSQLERKRKSSSSSTREESVAIPHTYIHIYTETGHSHVCIHTYTHTYNSDRLAKSSTSIQQRFQCIYFITTTETHYTLHITYVHTQHTHRHSRTHTHQQNTHTHSDTHTQTQTSTNTHLYMATTTDLAFQQHHFLSLAPP